MSGIIHQLKTMMEEWCHLEIEHEMNDKQSFVGGAYYPLEHALLQLAFVSEVLFLLFIVVVDDDDVDVMVVFFFLLFVLIRSILLHHLCCSPAFSVCLSFFAYLSPYLSPSLCISLSSSSCLCR